MRRQILLAAAVALTVASSTASRAEEAAPTGAAPDADCNRVIKASTESDKKPSPQQLANELNLPIEKVNACLRLVRHSGSGAPPATAE